LHHSKAAGRRLSAETDKSVLSRILKLFKSEAAKTSAPASLSVKFEPAHTLTQQGQYVAATATCEEMLRLQTDHVESMMSLAEIAARKEDAEPAIEGDAKAIDLNPEHAPAHYKRGNLLKDRGEYEGALANYDRAIALNPRYSQAFCNRGVVLAHLRRPEAALDSYDRAISLNPNDALAHYNRSAVLRELGQQEAALTGYDQAIAIKPDYAEAHCNRGALFTELERWEPALASYERAIEIHPRSFEAHFGRGVAFQGQKAWDAALASYARAIEIHPGSFEAHFARGIVFQGQKAWDAALTAYARAIEINPDHAEAHNNRGVALMELRRWDEARASLDRAIASRPEFAEAFCNRGLLASNLRRYETALANFDRAIGLEPEHAEAFYNRADALINMKQFAAAIASYDRAIALKRDFRFLLGMRQHAKMNLCDWSDLEPDLERLTAGIEADAAVSPPFPLLALLDSPPLHHQAAQIWVREQHTTDRVCPAIPKLPAGDRIRIGYFSADFHDHPVALLMAGLFELHDRSTFEVTAFSFGPDTQAKMRKRLEQGFDRFLDVRDKSDQEISRLARSLPIDIAVDLGGYTASSRTGIFAERAAPIQVNFLGYPATMGAEYMDYLIGDRTVVPQTCRRHYTEKIVYLPNSYLPADSTLAIAETVFTREELDLPGTAFVFCCFNNNYKITPSVFDSWMRILGRVENSVLWLSENNPTAAANLRQEASRRGVNAARLIFAKRLSGLPEHLARHRAADLFLDTRPYNAHATAIDALWAGLPVLTCMGETFAGRVAASLLRAVGLPELIATTSVQYEELAVRLAANPAELARIKGILAANRLRTPLFDTRSYTKDLEAAYAQIYDRYHANLPPDHIYPPC
jgi:predicted O-linked N-acetylglucosamine transferase (SPINDLY family)